MRYQHRVFCNTENEWVFLWNYSDENLTECPNNSEHSIDADNQTIIQKDDTPLNPSESVYFSQVNTINSFFEIHTESMEMEEALNNCFVDFFDSSRKLFSYFDILFDGQGIYLYGDDINIITAEDFDDISDWIEDTEYDDDIASISLDTIEKEFGTGSLKVTFSESSRFKIYGIKKVFSSAQNWNAYDCFGIYNKLSENNSDFYFRLCLISSSGSKFFSNPSNLSNIWSETIFDFSTCDFKNDIKEIRIYIFPNCSLNLNINFDLLRISKINSYKSSGNVISSNIELDDDIDQLYYDIYADLPYNTEVISKISLDGGTNWHELTDSEYKSWVNVSEWSEYSSFNNIRNLKVQIILNSIDGVNTPLVDDYVIQYKVKE